MNDWIELNVPWSDFSKSELNKPGVLIEVQQDVVNRYLIGDINPEGGFCNCCGFYSASIVLRAKVLTSSLNY